MAGHDFGIDAKIVPMDLELASAVDARCRIFGEFRLRLGQFASEYFDKYLFESDPRLLAHVCQAMADLVPADTDLLGGLELGGVPIATVIGQTTGIPVVFVRKTRKTYGTRQLVEGPPVASRSITLVEDVITSGGAVGAAARALREDGARVSTVVCAIDRRPDELGVLDELSVSVRAALLKSDLDEARAGMKPQVGE